MIGLPRRHAAPPDPVPVERTCLCGATLYGRRTTRPGSLACDDCGRTWFLLPIDPRPPLPKAKPKRPRGYRKDAFKKAGGRAATATRRAAARVGGRVRDRAASGWGRIAAKSRSSKVRFLSVTAAAVCLAVGTGWWMASRAAATSARARLEAASEESRLAAAAGDFVRVRELLEGVAGDGGGADDGGLAAAATQRYREAVVVGGLATRTLHQVAAEAAAIYDRRFPDAWADRFDALYAGRWVLLDAVVRKEAIPPGEGSAEAEPVTETRLDIPFVIPEARFSVDAGGFDFGAPGPWSSPRRVLFAAPIAACAPLDRAGEEWVVRLAGAESLLWADAVSFAAIAYGGDVAAAVADVGETLERQRRTLGLDDRHFPTAGSVATGPVERAAAAADSPFVPVIATRGVR